VSECETNNWINCVAVGPFNKGKNIMANIKDIDFSDLVDTCDKKLFLHQFDDSENSDLKYEDIIDDLWYNCHNRLDSILPKDMNLLERIIIHNQMEVSLIDLKYCYCVDQCDSWIFDNYLRDDQVSERKCISIMNKVTKDPRHVTQVYPNFFQPSRIRLT